MDRELADFLAWLDRNGGRTGTGVTVTVTRAGSSATLTSAPAVVSALFDVARTSRPGTGRCIDGTRRCVLCVEKNWSTSILRTSTTTAMSRCDAERVAGRDWCSSTVARRRR
ncbi:hypothetical protein BN13_470019 [Nostocoides jenkinsii Ben 74]|uniref:Uncharacterized protein n=1 Tax=Nostocoides jenkinsii Ben 74 TaxID=1193518 RepID=A0A077MFA7_9MICO|nr:hypothetical protein BN13_470019 [Tetrasphaera jenkinsii Ben 74]